MKKFNEPIRYLIIGFLCQLLDFTITIVLFSLKTSLFLSNTLGYLSGSILSYIGHSKYTFKKKSKKLSSKKQIILFLMACLSGIISGYIVLKVFTLLNLNLGISKFFQLGIIAAVQYFFNSNVTYKK